MFCMPLGQQREWDPKNLLLAPFYINLEIMQQIMEPFSLKALKFCKVIKDLFFLKKKKTADLCYCNTIAMLNINKTPTKQKFEFKFVNSSILFKIHPPPIRFLSQAIYSC